MAVVPASADSLAHIALILQLLRGTPNPPNESEESLVPYLEEDVVYLDADAPAVCRLHKRRNADFVDIPWWTWRGEGDMNAKLGPVFARALAAFIRRHGNKCLPWGIGGQLSGTGEDADAKHADAVVRAEAVRLFMEEGLAAGSVTREPADNGVDEFLRSTVALMAERAGIDVDAVIAAVL